MNIPQIARYLVLLISAILTYFGLGTLMNLGNHPDLIGWFTAYALLAFVEATILLFCYFRLKQRSRNIFRLTLAILALNVIVVIFDQMGFIDIAYMLLNIITAALLYFSRKDFLPA